MSGDAGDPGTEHPSGTQTPDANSPTSPLDAISPNTISSMPSRDNLRGDDQDTYFKFSGGYHTYSPHTTSPLTGQVPDGGPRSAFSITSQSPGARFHSPTHTTPSSSFIPSQTPQSASLGANSIRSRGQTFPVLGIDTSMSSQSENMISKQLDDLMSVPTLETPVEEYGSRSTSSIATSDAAHLGTRSASATSTSHQGSPPSVMPPPLRPASVSPLAGSYSLFPSTPTQDDARNAMDLVMRFFQSQPNGVVDPDEYMTMGKLMEKLKVQGPLNELPGGMHSIDIQNEISKKRSTHSL